MKPPDPTAPVGVKPAVAESRDELEAMAREAEAKFQARKAVANDAWEFYTSAIRKQNAAMHERDRAQAALARLSLP